MPTHITEHTPRRGVSETMRATSAVVAACYKLRSKSTCRLLQRNLYGRTHALGRSSSVSPQYSSRIVSHGPFPKATQANRDSGFTAQRFLSNHVLHDRVCLRSFDVSTQPNSCS